MSWSWNIPAPYYKRWSFRSLGHGSYNKTSLKWHQESGGWSLRQRLEKDLTQFRVLLHSYWGLFLAKLYIYMLWIKVRSVHFLMYSAYRYSSGLGSKGCGGHAGGGFFAKGFALCDPGKPVSTCPMTFLRMKAAAHPCQPGSSRTGSLSASLRAECPSPSQGKLSQLTLTCCYLQFKTDH